MKNLHWILWGSFQSNEVQELFSEKLLGFGLANNTMSIKYHFQKCSNFLLGYSSEDSIEKPTFWIEVQLLRERYFQNLFQNMFMKKTICAGHNHRGIGKVEMLKRMIVGKVRSEPVECWG